MQEELFQKITGVELQQETDRYTDLNTYIRCRNSLQKSYANRRKWMCTAWDFYFLPTIPDCGETAQNEQFYVTIRENEQQPEIVLKKHSIMGRFISERSAGLTFQQFISLLRGSMEWIGEKSDVLLQEFAQKWRLFRYQVCLIAESIRECYEIPERKVQLTLDLFVSTRMCEGFSLQEVACYNNGSPARICVKRY